MYIPSTQQSRLATSLGGILLAGLLLPGSTTSSARAADRVYTAFTFDGNGPVGFGVPQTLTPPDAIFTVLDPYYGAPRTEVIRLNVVGETGPVAGHVWDVALGAPQGEDLAVGTYAGTSPSGVGRDPGQPYLWISGDTSGCSPTGSFTIHELAFDGDTLTSLAATYAFKCSSGDTNAGEIRYASTLGYSGLRLLKPGVLNAISFPDTIVGQTSAPATVTFENAGTEPFDIVIEPVSGVADDFGIASGTCGSSLGAGQSCSVDIVFHPADVWQRSGVLPYTTSVYGVPHEIWLSGAGIAAIRQLSTSPLRIDFGAVAPGSASATTDLTVWATNNLDTPISIESIAVVGDMAAAFPIVAQGCPIGQIDVGSPCTISLQFEPIASGLRLAVLRIVADTAGSPYEVPLSGTGTSTPSGVTWGSRYKAGPAYTWNNGGALGRTVQSGAQKLHLAYTTPRIGSRWVKDTGPYLGVNYVRSSSGSTWSTPQRVNPSSQHGDRVGLAAAGSRVYVTWVSQTKVVKYSRTAPRVLYVRVNTRHGATTRWKSMIRLTAKSGRVDFPTIAASGADAYIAFTDSVTGSVRVAASHDRGATWKKTSLGTTTLSTREGKAGWPSVAVSGSTVAVAWIADSTGRILMRVSTDRGATWGETTEVSPQSNGGLSVAVRDTRIAVAWTTDDVVVVRQRTGGTWGEALVVAWCGRDFAAYSPVVVLQDPNRIAISWAEEVLQDDRSNLYWVESATGGSTWFAEKRAGSASSSARRWNDWPSVVWPSAGNRYVVWNGWTSGTNSLRLYLLRAKGTPVGITVTAPVWEPAPAAPDSMAADRHERTPAGR